MFITTLVSTSLVLSASANSAPSRDWSAELSQVTQAALRQTTVAQPGTNFYEGRDAQGQSCLVTVQFDKNGISFEVTGNGARHAHDEDLLINVPAKSRDLTKLEVSAQAGTLDVTVAQEITPYKSDRVDHYAYALKAAIDESADGIARLTSVSVSRDEKGKKAQAACGALKPLLALDEATLDAMNAAASRKYMAEDGDDKRGETIEMSLDSCTLDSATEVTCDASLATDYTPDTLHVTMGIRGGRLTGVKKIDFEPGC